MHLRDLISRREVIRSELVSIYDAHPDTLPDEARSREAALREEAERLNTQEQRLALIDSLDRGAAGTALDGGRGGFDALAAQVRAVDVIRAQLGGSDAACGRAREVSAELARQSGQTPEGLYWPWRQENQRTLGLVTGGGSNLIETSVSPATIEILRTKSAIMRGGATVIAGLTGNFAVPRLTGSSSIYWVLDGSPVTQSNPTFDQVLFTPHHCGGLVGITRQTLQQSSPDAFALVENDLTALIATAIDVGAISGTGGAQPTGILNLAGLPIVSGGTNGLAITWANLQALVGAVDTANALDGRLGFITNAKVAKSMRTTLKTTSDTASNFILSEPNTLAGYPLFNTQNVPSNLTKGSGTALSAVIFGDLSSVFIAAWSMLDLLANPYDSTAYAAGAVLVRAMATIDVGVRHIESLAAIKDAIAP